MEFSDVAVAARDAQLVSLEQHVGVRAPERRLEPVRRQLDQEPERIGEIDRVEDAAILDAGVLDAAIVKTLDRLGEAGARYREGDVMDGARSADASVNSTLAKVAP